MTNLKEKEMTQHEAINLVTHNHTPRAGIPGQWRVYAEKQDVVLEIYPNAPTKVATKAD